MLPTGRGIGYGCWVANQPLLSVTEVIKDNPKQLTWKIKKPSPKFCLLLDWEEIKTEIIVR